MSGLGSLFGGLFGGNKNPDPIKPDPTPTPAPQKDEPVPLPIKSKAPWMDELKKHIGLDEHTAEGGATVSEMHKIAGLSKSDQKPSTAWCGSCQVWNFVKNCGYKREWFPKSAAWARSWSWISGWGIKLDKPTYGAFINFERNGPGGDSHITCYDHTDANGNWVCCGGNQGDKLQPVAYNPKSVIAITWPPQEVLKAAGLL